MDYQLEYKLSTFPSCKWIVTATAEYRVTHCAGHIKYTDTLSSHNKLLLEWKYQGSFLVAKHLRISETESWKNLELSQNTAQNESGTWCLELLTVNCFASIVVPSLVLALLTTDGAISNSKKTGDRLLAVWHKIKIQILLEKLTLNRTPRFSVYHVSRAWAMFRKTFHHRRKSFCLQKCLSIYGRWLMCLFSRTLILIRGMDHKSRSWGGTCTINLKWWVVRCCPLWEV